MINTFVTVIIPTYKDWLTLTSCLEALSNQNFSKEKFEIIVVNNHPTDVVPDHYRLPDNCTVISEKLPGSYAARNAAIRVSKGNIIGFTDSDCIPDSDWIKNAVTYFENNEVYKRIGGSINLFFSSSKPNKVELYEKIYAFNQDMNIEKYNASVTANMFTYRYVFNEVGLFNEQLLSGGDYEWNVRAENAGFKIGYAEYVVVDHPARYQLHELTKKAKRVGGGQASFSGKRDSNKFVSLFKFLYDLRPPLNSISLINSKGKDLNLQQKLTVFMIRYYLNILTAYEKLNVQIGKKPNRA